MTGESLIISPPLLGKDVNPKITLAQVAELPQTAVQTEVEGS